MEDVDDRMIGDKAKKAEEDYNEEEEDARKRKTRIELIATTKYV